MGLRGKAKPEFLSAALTRSRDSFTAASGSPTREKCGRPREAMSTSTSTCWASMPRRAALVTFESMHDYIFSEQ